MNQERGQRIERKEKDGTIKERKRNCRGGSKRIVQRWYPDAGEVAGSDVDSAQGCKLWRALSDVAVGLLIGLCWTWVEGVVSCCCIDDDERWGGPVVTDGGYNVFVIASAWIDNINRLAAWRSASLSSAVWRLFQYFFFQNSNIQKIIL